MCAWNGTQVGSEGGGHRLSVSPATRTHTTITYKRAHTYTHTHIHLPMFLITSFALPTLAPLPLLFHVPPLEIDALGLLYDIASTRPAECGALYGLAVKSRLDALEDGLTAIALVSNNDSSPSSCNAVFEVLFKSLTLALRSNRAVLFKLALELVGRALVRGGAWDVATIAHTLLTEIGRVTWQGNNAPEYTDAVSPVPALGLERKDAVRDGAAGGVAHEGKTSIAGPRSARTSTVPGHGDMARTSDLVNLLRRLCCQDTWRGAVESLTSKVLNGLAMTLDTDLCMVAGVLTFNSHISELEPGSIACVDLETLEKVAEMHGVCVETSKHDGPLTRVVVQSMNDMSCTVVIAPGSGHCLLWPSGLVLQRQGRKASDGSRAPTVLRIATRLLKIQSSAAICTISSRSLVDCFRAISSDGPKRQEHGWLRHMLMTSLTAVAAGIDPSTRLSLVGPLMSGAARRCPISAVYPVENTKDGGRDAIPSNPLLGHIAVSGSTKAQHDLIINGDVVCSLDVLSTHGAATPGQLSGEVVPYADLEMKRDGGRIIVVIQGSSRKHRMQTLATAVPSINSLPSSVVAIILLANDDDTAESEDSDGYERRKESEPPRWTWSQGAHPGAIAKLLPPFVANVTSKVDTSALLSLMGFTSPTDGGRRSAVSAHEMHSIEKTVRFILILGVGRDERDGIRHSRFTSPLTLIFRVIPFLIGPDIAKYIWAIRQGVH